MRRVLILGIAMLAANAALAADSRFITIPEPTPIPAPLDKPRRKSDLQQPKPDERGTEQIPLVVKIVPAEVSPEQKQRDDEKAELDQQTVRNLVISTNKLLFIGTAVLALATGGLALVAFFQMRDARESIAASVKLADAAVAHAGHAEQAIRVSEKSAERQLRAYVSAIPNFITFHPDNNSFSIRYAITNHGQTPAYQMTGQASIEVLSYPLPPDWQFPTPPETQSRLSWSILLPGQRSPAVTRMRQSLTASEITRVTAATERRIFVYGVIRYLDVFDRPQHTRFCYSVSDGELLSSIVAGSLERPDDMIFEVAERYNEAT